MGPVVQAARVWHVLETLRVVFLFIHVHPEPLKVRERSAPVTVFVKNWFQLIQWAANWNIPCALKKEIAPATDDVNAAHRVVVHLARLCLALHIAQ